MKQALAYIAVVWRIFTRDLGRLVKNPVALIVVLGICLMPSLYAWYVVMANWEPYQETANLKVGVANEDEGCDLEAVLEKAGVTLDEAELPARLDVGAEVIAKLHDNHELGWEFVTEDEAIERVRSGEYYAAIIVPKEFSADFASVFSGSFTRPTLDYYVNEKLSSVAPHVTSQGAETLEQTIDATFVSSVSEAVVDIAQAAATLAEKKADEASGSLTKGVTDTAEALGKARDMLVGLGPAVGATKEAAANATAVLAEIRGALPGLTQKLTDAETALKKARDDVNRYGLQAAHDLSTASERIAEEAAGAQGALGVLSADAGALEGKAAQALAEAESVLARTQTVIDTLESAADATGADAPRLKQALGSLQTQVASLEDIINALTSVNADAAAYGEAARKAAGTLAEATRTDADDAGESAASFETSVIPQLTESLDDAASAIGAFRGNEARIQATLDDADDVLGELTTILDEAESGAAAAADTLATVDDALISASESLNTLQSSAAVKRIAELLDVDPEEVGGFMASPVTLKKDVFYPVENYGSGVAPFFTNLALWAAGFILLAMIKLRVDPEGLPPFTPTQCYWGRWLLFMTLSVAQALVAGIGDVVIGVQCVNPVAYVAACVVTVIVDMNIMYALAYAFRHVGKALNVLLLIIQIPGSSGLFPVEMMPPVYQAIHPFLPFTYSCNALREAIGGFYGADYALDLLALAAYIPGALVFGIVVGNYAFNLNLLFDRKLVETDLLVTDNDAGAQSRLRLRTIVKAMLGSDTFREGARKRMRRFQRRYPALIRAGWIALFAQPVIMFVLMNLLPVGINGKIVLLFVMVGTIVLVDGYLILVEYVNSDLSRQWGLAGLSAGELREQARSRAPIYRFFAHLAREPLPRETAKAATTSAASSRDVDASSADVASAPTTPPSVPDGSSDSAPQSAPASETPPDNPGGAA